MTAETLMDGYSIVLAIAHAELPHKILHVIVHGKADELACVVEFLCQVLLGPDWSPERRTGGDLLASPCMTKCQEFSAAPSP